MWPSKLVNNFKLVRDQTLTTLSQPPDTINGEAGLGLKRTQETQSVCPSSLMVYLHSPRVFQTWVKKTVVRQNSDLRSSLALRNQAN